MAASDIWLVGDEVDVPDGARVGTGVASAVCRSIRSLRRTLPIVWSTLCAGPREPEPWLISVNSTAIIGRAVLAHFPAAPSISTRAACLTLRAFTLYSGRFASARVPPPLPRTS